MEISDSTFSCVYLKKGSYFSTGGMRGARRAAQTWSWMIRGSVRLREARKPACPKVLAASQEQGSRGLGCGSALAQGLLRGARWPGVTDSFDFRALWHMGL